MGAEYPLKCRFKFGDNSDFLPLKNYEDRYEVLIDFVVESLSDSNVWISELFNPGLRKLIVGVV